ncbi:MAG: DUF1614 domain-containing protein [Dehalococcoidia bacterium]|nr:DUF1614 domain-containing protein [Dehalococcoidia bacterium]
MFFFPLGCLVGLLFLLFIPLLIISILFDLVTFSFEKIGLSPEMAVVIVVATLVGSIINIPVTKRKIEYVRDSGFLGFFGVPRTVASGVAVNVGGAIIPGCLSAYLLTMVPSPGSVAIATAAMTVISRLLARPVPGVGIRLPMFIPPIAAAILALLLCREFAAPCAYVAGTMGTLIGADLLNLHRIRNMRGVVSIGGAGVFDGIFLVGVISVLLTALF